MVQLFFNLWYLWLLMLLVFLFRLFKPKIKGYFGEKAVSALLTRLETENYKIIHDVMLEIEGKTTQIDHIIISNFGIFVIETKNYKGRILGDEYGEYWTQVIYKRKERLYNPIRQNYGHIQALKHHLKKYVDLKFISIICFSVNADIRVKTTTDVIYSVNLIKTIRKYDKVIIPNNIVNEIYEYLLTANRKGKDLRKQHVEKIHQKKKEKRESINSNICPKCGSKLVSRKGKYGQFIGCSNYPKCKFTNKV